MKIRYAIVVASVLAAVASCSDQGPGGHGIAILHGDNQTGVAAAHLDEPLVVQIRDSTGALAPQGTVVRFSTVFQGNDQPYAFVRGPASQSFSPFEPVETDAQGRASVDVELGARAGTAKILIEVPIMALRDTAHFEIVAGPATQLLVAPLDTALYVGASYQLRASLADRFGNPRPDGAVTVTSLQSGLSVTPPGTIVAGSIGRYDVQLSATGLASRVVHVSVVPQGRIAAVRDDAHIVSMNLDGSGVIDRTTAPDGGIGVYPKWMPGTDDIVYAASNGTIEQLKVVNAAGVARLFFPVLPQQMSHQAHPGPTADGTRLYFIAWDTRCGPEHYCLHRSLIDGMSIEVLPTAAGEVLNPSPSPNGARVAYVIAGVIRALRVADSSISRWSLAGTHPSWAPDGNHIAYTAPGSLTLVNPDGSGAHVLSATLPSGSIPMGWSADAHWLLARSSDGRYYLVDGSTGTAIVLPYSGNLGAADLKL